MLLRKGKQFYLSQELAEQQEIGREPTIYALIDCITLGDPEDTTNIGCLLQYLDAEGNKQEVVKFLNTLIPVYPDEEDLYRVIDKLKHTYYSLCEQDAEQAKMFIKDFAEYLKRKEK